MNISDPAEAASAFDAISYSKSAALLNMLKWVTRFLGGYVWESGGCPVGGGGAVGSADVSAADSGAETTLKH